MSVMTKIKLGAAVIIGVPIAGAAAYAGYDTYANGAGSVHVQAPYEDTVTVFVDGEEKATLAAGHHQVFKVEQGPREIKLVTGQGAEKTHSVEIGSGFYEALFPASKQCFADLDAYETFYGKAKPPEMPEVEQTYSDGAPIDVSSSAYFSEAALPTSVKEDSTVHLILEIPCDLVGKDAAAVREALGFTPDNMVER